MLSRVPARQPQETQLYGDGDSAEFLRTCLLVLVQDEDLEDEIRVKSNVKMDCLQSQKKEFQRMRGMLVMLVRQYSAVPLPSAISLQGCCVNFEKSSGGFAFTSVSILSHPSPFPIPKE